MKRGLSFLLFFIFLLLSACVPRRPITELCLSYTPQYAYSPKEHRTSPTGYTIGIINMLVDLNNKSPFRDDLLSTPVKDKVQMDFIQAVSNGLEKIVISKGMTISGPFKTYEEMTYPQRTRCSYLIRPHLTLEVSPSITLISRNATYLFGYGGPGGENWVFGKKPFKVTVSAKFDYIILDPLTQEKLELHTIQTEEITKQCDILFQEYNEHYPNGTTKSIWEPIWKQKSLFNCDNFAVIFSQIIDEMYNGLMGKIDNLVSVEEFNSLKKYKEELRQKKVY